MDLKYGLVYRDDIKFIFGLIGMEFLCENFKFFYLQLWKVLENWHDLFLDCLNWFWSRLIGLVELWIFNVMDMPLTLWTHPLS